jgi:hypothetical protein
LGRRILGVFDSMADKSTRNPRNKTITRIDLRIGGVIGKAPALHDF